MVGSMKIMHVIKVFLPQVKLSSIFPYSSWDEGRLTCFISNGMPTSRSHLERGLVSSWHWRGTRRSGHNSKATYFPIHSRSGLILLHQFEYQPRINSQNEGSSEALVANWKRATGSTFNSAGGLKPLWQLKRKAAFHASTQVENLLPVWNGIHSLRPTSEQERKPEVPSSTWDEALFNFNKPIGVQRGPSQHHSISDFP